LSISGNQPKKNNLALMAKMCYWKTSQNSKKCGRKDFTEKPLENKNCLNMAKLFFEL
jgi:hypothetical protein